MGNDIISSQYKLVCGNDVIRTDIPALFVKTMDSTIKCGVLCEQYTNCTAVNYIKTGNGHQGECQLLQVENTDKDCLQVTLMVKGRYLEHKKVGDICMS